MDYREASVIVTRLGADPSNLVILNNTFPSFKTDFERRFDVKRITVTGFVDFFTKFREVFDETKGIADNSVLFNDKFDRIINNINDLRAILPTKDQIRGIKQSIKSQLRNAEGRVGRALVEIDDRLGALQRRLPDEAVFQRLAQLDPQAQFQQLAQLQNRFDNLPSRDQVQDMINRADALSAQQFVQLISPLADSVTTGFDEVNRKLNTLRAKIVTKEDLADAVQVITDSIKAGASPAEVRQIIGDAVGELPTKAQVQGLMREIQEGRVGTEELKELIAELIKGGIEAEAQVAPIADASGRLPAREIAKLAYIPMGVDANIEGRMYDTIGMTNEGQGGHLRIAFSSNDAPPGTRSRGFNREELYVIVNKSLPLQQVVRRFTGGDWDGERTQAGKKRLIGLFVNSVEQKLGEAKSSGRRPSIKPSSSSSSSGESGDWTDIEPAGGVGRLFETQGRTISRSRSKTPQPTQESARTDRSRSPSVESNPRSPKPEGGKGVMVMGGRKPILIKKIGRGLEPVETPSHIQFGKYLLHANNMNKSVLSVHHKGGGRVQSIPVQTMSEDLRDFIVDVLQNKRASQKEFSRLPLSEQKLFEKMSKGAGVHHTLGLKPVKSDDDNKIEERFEVLKGEWLAGNNSHELVRELRKIVIYFMEEGRLTKSQARELLLTIN